MTWRFELAAGPFGTIAEGPSWDGRFLFFTLNRENRIMRYEPRSGECVEWSANTRKTLGTAFDAKGVLYGCCAGGRSIVRFDANGAMTTVLDRLDGKRLHNPNDLAFDRQGRLWFSNSWHQVLADPGDSKEFDDESMCRAEQAPDGKWTIARVTFDTTSPNGVAVSPDQKILYVSECDMREDRLRELRAYPIQDDGTLGKHTVLHQFGKDYRGVHRAVDGMRVDAEGNIIATAGYPKSGPGPLVYVFSPSGRVLETHPLPDNAVPTNCSFAGEDLRTLYVTTTAGHLFRAETEQRGFQLAA